MTVSDAGSVKLVHNSYLYDLSRHLNADVTMYYDVTMYFYSVHGKTITAILSKSASCNSEKKILSLYRSADYDTFQEIK